MVCFWQTAQDWVEDFSCEELCLSSGIFMHLSVCFEVSLGEYSLGSELSECSTSDSNHSLAEEGPLEDH